MKQNNLEISKMLLEPIHIDTTTYTIGFLKTLTLAELHKIMEVHWPQCDSCNFDKEDCPCEWGTDEKFDDNDMKAHSCNCKHGWGGKIRRIISDLRREEFDVREREEVFKKLYDNIVLFTTRDFAWVGDTEKKPNRHVVRDLILHNIGKNRIINDDFSLACIQKKINDTYAVSIANYRHLGCETNNLLDAMHYAEIYVLDLLNKKVLDKNNEDKNEK